MITRRPIPPHLSSRERQIITLLVDGRTPKQISCWLGITRGTVCRHVLRAMRRNDANTREQLIAWLVLAGALRCTE